MQIITEKFTHLVETRNLLRDTIIEGGIEVPADTPFRDYVTKNREAIAAGGGVDEESAARIRIALLDIIRGNV